MNDPINEEVLRELGFRSTEDKPAKLSKQQQRIEHQGYPAGCTFGWYRPLGRFRANDEEVYMLLEPVDGEWSVTLYEHPYPTGDCVVLPHPVPNATALRLLVRLLTDPAGLVPDAEEDDVLLELEQANAELAIKDPFGPGWGCDSYEADLDD